MIEVTTENSFVSMEQANELFNLIPGCAEWATLEDDSKARLLIHASKMLGHLLFEDFPYISASQRVFLELHKAKVVEASIYQAWYLHKNAETIDQVYSDYIEGKTSESIGPISSSKVPGFSYKKIYHPIALKLFSFYFTSSKTIMRA